MQGCKVHNSHNFISCGTNDTIYIICMPLHKFTFLINRNLLRHYMLNNFLNHTMTSKIDWECSLKFITCLPGQELKYVQRYTL